jgi:hypothetical protein
MRPKTSRLLLVLVGTMLAACAGQTQRSSTGGGPKTVASEPISYVDPPRRGTEPATAPPEPAPPKAAPPPAEEPVADIRPEGEPADMVPVPSPDSFEADADDHKISDPVMA